MTAPLSGRRVLLVDDESMVLMLIEDMLLDLGAGTVLTAMEMEEAARLADEAEIDLAVLDVNLSGQHSYHLAERLKERGIPVLLATGYDAGDPVAGASDFPTLTKPFDQDALAGALGGLLPK